MCEQNEKRIKGKGLDGLSRQIIRFRFPILILFVAMAVYSVLSLGRVQVNGDLSAFLGKNTETRQSLDLMEREFAGYASATIMIEEITPENAEGYAERIRAVPDVTSLSYDPATDYKENCSLFSVLFNGPENGEKPLAAMKQIREILGNEKTRIITEVGVDYPKQLAGEMRIVLILCGAVIVAVLLLTSRSFFDIVIYLPVFFMAGLLNMGTNFWLGEISSITNTIAVILQLALAIDYAIIFSHRYQDEVLRLGDDREALVGALSGSIKEVCSSALTTVSCLCALILMQFRLGRDLGLVLSKGILFSMLTVFLFMPALLSLFPKALKKTRHRSLVPNMEGWGRILTKKIPVFLIIFALILPPSVYLASRVSYSFSDPPITGLVPNERRDSDRVVRNIFGGNTMIVMLVPNGDYEHEGEILDKAAALPEIMNATGMARIRADETHYITSRLSAGEIREMLGIEQRQCEQLLTLCAFDRNELKEDFDVSSYRAPLVDLAMILFRLVDSGTVEITEEQAAYMAEIRPQLEMAVAQLKGPHYSRLLFVSQLPSEGQASEDLLETLRGFASPYYGEDVHMAGQLTSARDLKDSFEYDSTLVNWLSIAFVFVILLFTFRSPLTAALLVFVIQGSIWINFSFSTLFGITSSFVTRMIVLAIQMGATIDYAIVITNRYRSLKAELPKRDAMVRAVNEAFPTVVTSGTIMAVAGLLVAFRISDVYVGHIGLFVGRGAIVSAVMVLTVLPQLLLIFDTWMDRTTFRPFWKRSGEKTKPGPVEPEQQNT